MAEKAERPQDVDRRRTRRGLPSSETLALLAEYRAALRAELAGTLERIRDLPPAAVDDRVALWRLARQTAAELREGDDVPPLERITGGASHEASRPPRLTSRDRAALER